MRVISIGRNAKNDIVLNDPMVSREHARLFIHDNGQIMIKDSGSSNGTFVNGNKVVESYLKPGDIVKCGGAFINWQQYKTGTPYISPPIQQPDFQQYPEYSHPGQPPVETNPQQTFSIGLTLRYLSSRIVETGDLFKTNWDRTPSILFFLLLPLGLSLFALLYLYTKVQIDFIYQVFLPLILIGSLYGLAQFITIALLSINSSTTIYKTMLASSIYSFLQFCILFLLVLFFMISVNTISHSSKDILPLYVIFWVVILTLVICITISIVIFLYQYFREIGVSKSMSIHSVVVAITLNFFLEATIVYIFMLAVGDKFDHSFQNLLGGRFF
jgi:hypothetical protein